MILIGDGGHARDIADDISGYVRVAHHKLVVPATVRGEAVIIGINDPHTRDAVAKSIGVFDEVWTHSNAYIGPDCRVGVGTHINYGVTMTRTNMGHHCTVAPGVTICGDVTIGHRVFIGAGAVIKNLVTIGDDAVIGAGAVVLRDVPAGATVVGNPGRVL